MTPPSTKPQEVRCWNCKHLRKVYRGAPRNGRLFSYKTHRCAITDEEFDDYWQITTTRVCRHHVQVGNWEAPPNILSAREAWLAMESFSQLSQSQRLRPTGNTSANLKAHAGIPYFSLSLGTSGMGAGVYGGMKADTATPAGSAPTSIVVMTSLAVMPSSIR